MTKYLEIDTHVTKFPFRKYRRTNLMTKMLLFFAIQAFFPLTFKNHKTAREKGDKFLLYSTTSTHFLGT